MSKLEEDVCCHGGQCKGCKLWYCLDDEIYHCYNCYDSLELCGKCTGLGDPGGWNWLCKSCYREDYISDKCTVCSRYRRITKNPCPYSHSIEEPAVCKSCYIKKEVKLI